MNISYILIACCLLNVTRLWTGELSAPTPITGELLTYSSSMSRFFSKLYANAKLSFQKYSVDAQLVWARWKGNRIFHACAGATVFLVTLLYSARYVHRTQEARLKRLIDSVLQSGKHSTELLKEIKEAAEKRNQSVQALLSSFGYALDKLPSNSPLTQSLTSFFSILEQTERLEQGAMNTIPSDVQKLLDDNQVQKIITLDTEQNKKTIIDLSSTAHHHREQLDTQKKLVVEFGEKCEQLVTQITGMEKAFQGAREKKEKT